MSSMKMHPLPENTGITSLNDLNKKHGVITFDRVVKKQDFQTGRVLYSTGIQWSWNPQEEYHKKSEEFGRLNEIMESYRNNPNIVELELDHFVEVQLIPNDCIIWQMDPGTSHILIYGGYKDQQFVCMG